MIFNISVFQHNPNRPNWNRLRILSHVEPQATIFLCSCYTSALTSVPSCTLPPFVELVIRFNQTANKRSCSGIRPSQSKLEWTFLEKQFVPLRFLYCESHIVDKYSAQLSFEFNEIPRVRYLELNWIEYEHMCWTSLQAVLRCTLFARSPIINF